ncbi:MAG: hypothetical protein KAQ65_12355 [Candidatus Thorarchaeota archaeon]|nr:hypothetical protein [Candidatus Thorarchaeota archaeon]
MEIQTVPMLRQVVEAVKKIQVKKRAGMRWLEHDEAAKAHRREIASTKALKDLEALKTGARADNYRTSFFR